MYPVFEVSGSEKQSAAWILKPDTSNLAYLDLLGKRKGARRQSKQQTMPE